MGKIIQATAPLWRALALMVFLGSILAIAGALVILTSESTNFLSYGSGILVISVIQVSIGAVALINEGPWFHNS